MNFRRIKLYSSNLTLSYNKDEKYLKDYKEKSIIKINNFQIIIIHLKNQKCLTHMTNSINRNMLRNEYMIKLLDKDIKIATVNIQLVSKKLKERHEYINGRCGR